MVKRLQMIKNVALKYNKRANEKAVKTVFTVIVAEIAIVNLYNAVTGLIA